MENETIAVRATDSGHDMDVVVLSKRVECIQVVIGKGEHSLTCDLTPTRSGLAYAGSVRGRELVYDRTPEQVQTDLDRVNPALRRSRRFD